MNNLFYKMKIKLRKLKKMNQNFLNPQLNKKIKITINQIYLKRLIIKFNQFKKNNQLNRHNIQMNYR